MAQQGIAAAVVEDLTGLEKLISDQHIGERCNILGPGNATQWGELDEAAFERLRIRSKVSHALT